MEEKFNDALAHWLTDRADELPAWFTEFSNSENSHIQMRAWCHTCTDSLNSLLRTLKAHDGVITSTAERYSGTEMIQHRVQYATLLRGEVEAAKAVLATALEGDDESAIEGAIADYKRACKNGQLVPEGEFSSLQAFTPHPFRGSKIEHLIFAEAESDSRAIMHCTCPSRLRPDLPAMLSPDRYAVVGYQLSPLYHIDQGVVDDNMKVIAAHHVMPVVVGEISTAKVEEVERIVSEEGLKAVPEEASWTLVHNKRKWWEYLSPPLWETLTQGLDLPLLKPKELPASVQKVLKRSAAGELTDEDVWVTIRMLPYSSPVSESDVQRVLGEEKVDPWIYDFCRASKDGMKALGLIKDGVVNMTNIGQFVPKVPEKIRLLWGSRRPLGRREKKSARHFAEAAQIPYGQAKRAWVANPGVCESLLSNNRFNAGVIKHISSTSSSAEVLRQANSLPRGWSTDWMLNPASNHLFRPDGSPFLRRGARNAIQRAIGKRVDPALIISTLTESEDYEKVVQNLSQSLVRSAGATSDRGKGNRKPKGKGSRKQNNGKGKSGNKSASSTKASQKGGSQGTEALKMEVLVRLLGFLSSV